MRKLFLLLTISLLLCSCSKQKNYIAVYTFPKATPEVIDKVLSDRIENVAGITLDRTVSEMGKGKIYFSSDMDKREIEEKLKSPHLPTGVSSKSLSLYIGDFPADPEITKKTILEYNIIWHKCKSLGISTKPLLKVINEIDTNDPKVAGDTLIKSDSGRTVRLGDVMEISQKQIDSHIIRSFRDE